MSLTRINLIFAINSNFIRDIEATVFLRGYKHRVGDSSNKFIKLGDLDIGKVDVEYLTVDEYIANQKEYMNNNECHVYTPPERFKDTSDSTLICIVGFDFDLDEFLANRTEVKKERKYCYALKRGSIHIEKWGTYMGGKPYVKLTNSSRYLINVPDMGAIDTNEFNRLCDKYSTRIEIGTKRAKILKPYCKNAKTVKTFLLYIPKEYKPTKCLTFPKLEKLIFSPSFGGFINWASIKSVKELHTGIYDKLEDLQGIEADKVVSSFSDNVESLYYNRPTSRLRLGEFSDHDTFKLTGHEKLWGSHTCFGVVDLTEMRKRTLTTLSVLVTVRKSDPTLSKSSPLKIGHLEVDLKATVATRVKGPIRV